MKQINKNIIERCHLKTEQFLLIQTDDKGEYFGGERFNYRAKEFPSIGTNRKAKNTQNEFSIRAYPNPVHDVLYIDLKDGNQQIYETTIYSLSGELIKHQTCKKVSACQINVSTFPSGVYLIELKDMLGKVIKHSKFLKQ